MPLADLKRFTLRFRSIHRCMELPLRDEVVDPRRQCGDGCRGLSIRRTRDRGTKCKDPSLVQGIVDVHNGAVDGHATSDRDQLRRVLRCHLDLLKPQDPAESLQVMGRECAAQGRNRD